ncbi:MAG: cysteine--tRNA ligase [Clostridia bacterium]|nr:cysteine--tRNA ligase [Clostridia bacterium]MBQ5798363.1 cysteine--tRNA ligase [Clostridia bacterium]
MKIFNTLTRTREELIPIKEGEYKIYACGPTVYNFIHIGNARPLCVFDVLRRYLEWRGNKVTFVQNFTDIDDKLIRKANENGTTVAEVAKKFIEEYWTDADGLNIRRATVHPKATENIDAIQGIITALIEKGYAYESKGDVYFRARKFDEYGKLSHQPLDDLEAGARIDVTDIKEDAMDFCLWKAAKEGEPYWESPWGKGRPGWHIECSAMAGKYLGNTIDIHCGGQDLVFPHHENEIAQSECANGCEFAHYWMHNGYINVDNRKMSKSLGNFFTVREVAEVYGYEPIRYIMISSHYRSPINYSVEIIEQSKNALDRLYKCREGLKFAIEHAEDGGDKPEFLIKRKAEFIEAMDDDLNTADALGTVFNLVKDINLLIADGGKKDSLLAALAAYDELCGVLGLVYNVDEDSLDSEIEELIAKRTQARKEKNWGEADAIRDKLNEMGIVLEDTPQGVKWSRK